VLAICSEAAATQCVGWAGAPDTAENESTETQGQDSELDSGKASMTDSDTLEEEPTAAAAAAKSSSGPPESDEADSSSTTEEDPQPVKPTSGTLCWATAAAGHTDSLSFSVVCCDAYSPPNMHKMDS